MSYVQSVSYALTPAVPFIAVIVTFLIHIGFGNELSPAEVFYWELIFLKVISIGINLIRAWFHIGICHSDCNDVTDPTVIKYSS